jgi:hypothetical protein
MERQTIQEKHMAISGNGNSKHEKPVTCVVFAAAASAHNLVTVRGTQRLFTICVLLWLVVDCCGYF